LTRTSSTTPPRQASARIQLQTVHLLRCPGEGFTPATVINDAPLFFDATTCTGGKPWEPKSYDGKFDGPMTMRSALARSKNMVSIRILQLGARNGQEWATLGFEADKHPLF
jgi:penicillin-binding protein 1A